MYIFHYEINTNINANKSDNKTYIYILFYRQKSNKKSPIFYSLSLIVLHALDAILLIILLPFIIWQWISANDRLKIILKAVVEVRHFRSIFNFRNLR